jgi:hypothetical protein
LGNSVLDRPILFPRPIGNGVAAAAMGACGYLVSNQAVFFLTAILAVPAVLALMRIRMGEVGQTKELEVGTAKGRDQDCQPTGMLERIPLDRSATPPSQQHSCSFPPTEAVQSSRLGRIICHGCR